MSDSLKRWLYGCLCGLPVYAITGLVTQMWPVAALFAAITSALAMKDWETHQARKGGKQ